MFYEKLLAICCESALHHCKDAVFAIGKGAAFGE